MNLIEAINKVEAAVTALGNADSAQLAAQAKFEAAQSAKAVADNENASAVESFNAALDDLISAATAAKR